MVNPFDKLLRFMPGVKAYLVGLAMILTGAAQMLEAWQSDALFGPASLAGWDQILEGLGILAVRRGIKTDMGQAVLDTVVQEKKAKAAAPHTTRKVGDNDGRVRVFQD